MGVRVNRTRNANTMTESQYWSLIRSALRKAFRYWKPAIIAKMNARRNCKKKGRQKYEYKCSSCGKWYAEKNIQIDHIIPVGSLKKLEDLPGFIERLTPESHDSFQVLCKDCHKIKTNNERKNMKK